MYTLRAIASAIIAIGGVSSCWASAAQHDYIHLASGGFLGGSVDLLINLDSGKVVSQSMPQDFGSNPPPKAVERHGIIASEELKRLTEIVRQGLATGFKTERCKQQDEAYRKVGKSPPLKRDIMDGFIEMDVSLGDHSETAPGPSCSNPAVEAISRASWNAERGMSVTQ